MRRILAVVVALGLAQLMSGTALAHGELESEFPEAESTLGKPPDHVILNFTEAPTNDAVFNVTDGCGTEMIAEAAVQQRAGHLFLTKDGQPGTWKVSYKVVSAEDGHLSKGSYALTVKGKKDCSPDEPSGNGGNGGGNAAGGTGGAPTGDEDDGGSFPVVPVIIGTVALLGLAFIARRATS